MRGVLPAVLVMATAGLAGAEPSPSLSGAWLFGDYQPEPKQAAVSVAQRCWNGGVDFTLTQTGKKLTGKAQWIEPTGGVPRPPRDETEKLTGMRDGKHLVLTGHHKLVTFRDTIRDDGNRGAQDDGTILIARTDPR